MQIQILNSFKGDDIKDISTDTDEGRAQAAKLLAELLKSGSAVFLEREIDGETKTYRVTGYDPATDRLNIQIPTEDIYRDSMKDPVIGDAPIKLSTGKRRNRNIQAAIPSDSGRTVSVAPVSGGLDEVVEEPPRPELTWEAIRYGISKLCEDRGWHHGCPLPSATSEGHSLIVARGAPLHDRQPDGMPMNFNMTPQEFVCSNKDVDEDAIRLVNRWTPAPTRVEIFSDSKGIWKVRWPVAYERMRFELDSMFIRAGAVDWQTEMVAMRSLQEKITDGQFGSYMLSGAFPEKSLRSGVTYILRKGKPTIALTEKPLPTGKTQRRFLAALCLHGLAYYTDTWCGSQAPSDDVITHLMLIRTDEHAFWKKSGQHPITDPRAAI